MDRIPTNWRLGTIGDCCADAFTGKSPKYSKTKTEYRIIGQQANQRYGIDLRFVKYGTKEFGEAQEDRFFLKYNDVILNTLGTGSIGRSGIYKYREPILTDGHPFVFRTAKTCLPDYLFYYLRFSEKPIIDSASGSTNQRFLKLKSFLDFSIPIPPIPEQERIVARIEELFSQLDAGVETLKKIKAQLAVYRQAVLKEAFNGAFIMDSSPEFKIMRIDDFAKVDTGATPLTSNKAYYGGSIAWVASGKINEGTIFTPTDYITNLALKETNCKVFPVGTILVAMYGEGKTRGKCAELMIPAATNQALAAITLEKDSPIDKAFLKWFLIYNYQLIRRKAAGGVQPNLNLGIIKAISVKVFSKAAQGETVNQIEVRLSICESIEKTIDVALQQAEAMRQSILKNAFEGGL